MKRLLSFVTAFLMAGATGATAQTQTPAPAPSQSPASSLDLENVLYMDLSYGRVVIQLYPEEAPRTVARIKELVRKGFYNGLTFHRVIDGFMAQTGDPKGDGTGGSGKTIPFEKNDLLHLRGSVSMARGNDMNSADSQFFICFQPQFALDGKYTVFGRVISGMEYVDKIKRGEGPAFIANGHPDKIIRMQVAADAVKAGEAPPAVPGATSGGGGDSPAAVQPGPQPDNPAP